jgi:hypothetical protein
VSVGGVPLRNPSEEPILLRGAITQIRQNMEYGTALCIHVSQLAAAAPESPHGLSGGPVLVEGSDGVMRPVAIVTQFPRAAANRSLALGGDLLARHIEDVADALPEVREALRLSLAQQPPRTTTSLSEATLSRELERAHRSVLSRHAESRPADGWTVPVLSSLIVEITEDGAPSSAERDELVALCDALLAKQVLLDIGGGELALAQLQSIYQLSTGHWPSGASADVLLYEAADAGVLAARESAAEPLGPLPRFMVGIAAATSKRPDACPSFIKWLCDLGHQVSDACSRFDLLRKPTWLLIDLGDEPPPSAAAEGQAAWPLRVDWTYFCDADLTSGSQACDGTKEGLWAALTTVLRIAAQRPLQVDLSLPRHLMDRGIEDWDLLETDGEHEPLRLSCRPRLRWSQRRRSAELADRLRQRTAQMAWRGQPDEPKAGVLRSRDDLRAWAQSGMARSWVLGGHVTGAEIDALRVLLREGFGYLVWFPDVQLANERARAIITATEPVPPTAMKSCLPDHLPAFEEHPAAVIWDDPTGRPPYVLPAGLLQGP